MSPTAGGYPPRPPKSPTVWCHSKVTARAERSSLSPRRGMQLQSIVRGIRGMRLQSIVRGINTTHAQIQCHASRLYLLRVSATVGLVCWTRGLGGPRESGKREHNGLTIGVVGHCLRERTARVTRRPCDGRAATATAGRAEARRQEELTASGSSGLEAMRLGRGFRLRSGIAAAAWMSGR